VDNYINDIYPPVGYYGLSGVNASFGGLDYFTQEGNIDANWTDFRPLPLQTLQGNRNYAYYSGGTLGYDRTYDTQRKKYSDADPALEEYEVVRTRGGLWMSYTRIFPTNAYYNVYLRNASAFSADLTLDQIAAGPITNNLGTFGTTNALGGNNYRFAPLRDASSKLAVVNLPGTNSLRLTVSGPDFSSTRYGLSLAYLAFVPALVVESAASVTGPYTLDSSAAVEPGTRQITIPQNGGARFYRLRWDHSVSVTSINFANGKILMTYQ
jgi:hypothetical protein